MSSVCDNVHSNPYLINNVIMHASNDRHAATSLSHVKTNANIIQMLKSSRLFKKLKTVTAKFKDSKPKQELHPQLHRHTNTDSQTTPQKTDVDKNSWVPLDEIFHDYDDDTARLSFDERIRNLKVSLEKFKKSLDGNRFDDTAGHFAMDNMLQDILQLWTNEDTKFSDVNELRELTREVLVMYDCAAEKFYY